MLKRSHTAVLEKNETYAADFDTEPYEAGWAGEALFFVRVLKLEGSGPLTGSVQISPDGLHWCDEGSTIGPINEPGLYAVAVNNFGGWLRLSCRIDNGSQFKLMGTLALKES